jgi:hypothetical protein
MSSELVKEIIYKCLTSCPECSGSYVSKILRKRLICHCPCHHHDRLASQRKGDVEYYAEGEGSTKKGDEEEV